MASSSDQVHSCQHMEHRCSKRSQHLGYIFPYNSSEYFTEYWYQVLVAQKISSLVLNSHPVSSSPPPPISLSAAYNLLQSATTSFQLRFTNYSPSIPSSRVHGTLGSADTRSCACRDKMWTQHTRPINSSTWMDFMFHRIAKGTSGAIWFDWRGPRHFTNAVQVDICQIRISGASRM